MSKYYLPDVLAKVCLASRFKQAIKKADDNASGPIPQANPAVSTPPTPAAPASQPPPTPKTVTSVDPAKDKTPAGPSYMPYIQGGAIGLGAGGATGYLGSLLFGQSQGTSVRNAILGAILGGTAGAGIPFTRDWFAGKLPYQIENTPTPQEQKKIEENPGQTKVEQLISAAGGQIRGFIDDGVNKFKEEGGKLVDNLSNSISSGAETFLTETAPDALAKVEQFTEDVTKRALPPALSVGAEGALLGGTVNAIARGKADIPGRASSVAGDKSTRISELEKQLRKNEMDRAGLDTTKAVDKVKMDTLHKHIDADRRALEAELGKPVGSLGRGGFGVTAPIPEEERVKLREKVSKGKGAKPGEKPSLLRGMGWWAGAPAGATFAWESGAYAKELYDNYRDEVLKQKAIKAQNDAKRKATSQPAKQAPSVTSNGPIEPVDHPGNWVPQAESRPTSMSSLRDMLKQFLVA